MPNFIIRFSIDYVCILKGTNHKAKQNGTENLGQFEMFIVGEE